MRLKGDTTMRIGFSIRPWWTDSGQFLAGIWNQRIWGGWFGAMCFLPRDDCASAYFGGADAGRFCERIRWPPQKAGHNEGPS